MADLKTSTLDNVFLKSSFFEQLVEHVFIAEVLQRAWYSFGATVEVLRSEVDAYGYDLVLCCNDVIRHVQLKNSKHDAKTKVQKVNVALAKKPGGCVVWIFRDDRSGVGRMDLSYRFFGPKAGETPLSLAGFKVARHTKGNAEGFKANREAIRLVPITKFSEVIDIGELVKMLFGF